MNILVTGACGTWGREYMKQLLEQGHKIVGVDRDEQSMAECRRIFPEVTFFLEDFDKIDFTNLNTEILVHLAAYKHIDLCELNPADAVENNITKTVTLYDKAKLNNVRILYISTDKTISPISIYGMTKAMGERLTWAYGGCVARSGNIVGSNGSVIHIWREAVKNKKPLSVTDMGMMRYFIKVEDAVRISWEGFLAGKRLVLVDVGGHLTLGQIINNILAEFGYTIDTYEPGIEIIGLRPGERLIDEITWEYDAPYL